MRSLAHDEWQNLIGMVCMVATLITVYYQGRSQGFRDCEQKWDKIADRVATRLKKEGIEVVSDEQLQAIKTFQDDIKAPPQRHH